MQALLRARDLWEKSQPQLPIDLYPDDHAESLALDQQPETPTSGGVQGLGSGLLIERAPLPTPIAGSALDSTSTRRLATLWKEARAVAGGDRSG